MEVMYRAGYVGRGMEFPRVTLHAPVCVHNTEVLQTPSGYGVHVGFIIV